jgi:hypothetical protein
MRHKHDWHDEESGQPIDMTLGNETNRSLTETGEYVKNLLWQSIWHEEVEGRDNEEKSAQAASLTMFGDAHASQIGVCKPRSVVVGAYHWWGVRESR